MDETLPFPGMPALSAAQMGRVDHMMTDELGLDVLQLMERAGWAVATFARARFLAGDPRERRVVILAGSGGNGGDGLVAARLLLGWGARVTVALSHPTEQMRGAAAHQRRILTALGFPGFAPPTAEFPEADVVIDALLGFGLSGSPTGIAATLIRAANGQSAPILAVDLPSGLEATDGTIFDPCIRAAATLTLALPKTGLLTPRARSVVGELSVADIGVPEAAYTRLGITVGPVFATREIVRIA
jgi:NAD(P)H-hydrate epimerase